MSTLQELVTDFKKGLVRDVSKILRITYFFW